MGGLRATAGRLGPATASFARGLGRAALWVVAGLLRILALVERALASLVGAAAAASGRTVAFLERRATPERVLLGVTAAAAACLAASQFVDYRGVDVGRPGYADVSSVAPPPQVGLDTAGEAHAYILLPVAAIALGLAAVAVLRRRWRLGRLVAAAGAAGILVSLAIDLPQGLDAGTAGVAFAGAEATMKEGFYVQLVSSAVLVACGLLLGQYLHGTRGTARRRSRERPARTRRAPSVARGGA